MSIKMDNELLKAFRITNTMLLVYLYKIIDLICWCVDGIPINLEGNQKSPT